MRKMMMVKIVLVFVVTVVFSTMAWGKTVTLSWDASPSTVTGYNIYYDTRSSGALVGSGATEGDSPISVGDVLTYVIHELDDDAEHFFAVSAYDADGNESTYSNLVSSSAVSGPNSLPVLASIGNKSVLEAGTLSFTAAASDADDDVLTYSVNPLPDGAGFNSATGFFSWTPTLSQSNIYSLIFSVSDGTATDTETVQITVTDVVVNSAPVLAAIGNKGVNEGNTQYIPITATDSDSDSLSYSFSGMPEGAEFNSQTNVFAFLASYEDAGVYTITATVSDGSLTDSETFTITVIDVNRVPILNSVGSKSTAEGLMLSFTIIGSDPDDDALSYAAAGLPSGAVFNPTNRSFNWTPEFQASANTLVYPVTFTISDGVLEDAEIVTINVTNVNRPPVLAAIGAQSLVEGESSNLIVSASDPDNSTTLIYGATNLPIGAIFTPSTSSFNWIPEDDQAGVYTVIFNVSDGDLSDSEEVTFSVSIGNKAPVLTTVASQEVAEGAELQFDVAANDINGDSITFSASGLPDGAVFDPDSRRFTWIPDYTQAGDFTVNVTATDGQLSDVETIAIKVTNSNRSPVISGSPEESVMVTVSYSFIPTGNDPDGDTVVYSIANSPEWATFNADTGELSGVPVEAQIGNSANVTISASDGLTTVALAPFAINVIAYVYQDSDGDGVIDPQDAFPNDSNEWEDNDGDLLGNNSDPDDDNDGIADVRDGFPLDAAKSGWIISATSSTGGYLTPEGDTSVLYGGSRSYKLTPMAGYYINDLFVDNVSVGLVENYEFENIGSHHTINAVFALIPAGLSYDPVPSDLIGIERVDAGDARNNLVNDRPKLALDYRFRIALRDSVAADQRRVFVISDGYKYAMQGNSDVLNNGADYTFVTRFGASFNHQFHFVAEDLSGTQVWRYPENGDLPGPAVNLLDGKNLVGNAADIDAYALDAEVVFADARVYRWLPSSGPRGKYELIAGTPIASGEGYVLRSYNGSVLADLSNYGEITTSTHEFLVETGWNLISNPYGGNVALADIEIRVGNAAPVLWLTAAADNLIVDALYSYLGTAWGNRNEFASASGTGYAVLTPWVGYWIYINSTADDISLVFTKPLQ